MKHLFLAGALALAGLGLASTAAASDDCKYGPTDLPTYGYYSLCLLDDHSSSWSSGSSSYNNPVSTFLYQTYVAGNRFVTSYASAGLTQYESSSSWSGTTFSSYGTNLWAGESTYAYQGWTPIAGEGAWVGAGQYGYEQTGTWASSYSATYGSAGANVFVPVAGSQYAQVYYQQWNYNDQGCKERLVMYSYIAGDWTYEELIPTQDCSYEVEQLPELPDFDGPGQ